MSDLTPTKEDVFEPEHWDLVITPKTGLFDLNFREVWRYRDLLMLFIYRNFIAEYKQTILGPLWYLIQPLFTTLIFVLVFNRMAGISTDGVPPILFYLAGLANWNYFAECLNKTATTFRDNQGIFGKVYFPRLIVPLSIVATSLLRYGIQFLLFIGIYIFHSLFKGATCFPNAYALLFPLLILLLAGLGLGFGLIVTSLTNKYRDLVFLLQFGVQLMMYVTPIIYPLSKIPEKYQIVALLNPLSSIIETFKYGWLGEGTFAWINLAYSATFTALLLMAGVIVFNRTEKNFIDTV